MNTTTPTVTENNRARAPRRRWLRWLLGTVALIVALLIASISWLLGTASGLRFALARAVDHA